MSRAAKPKSLAQRARKPRRMKKKRRAKRPQSKWSRARALQLKAKKKKPKRLKKKKKPENIYGFDWDKYTIQSWAPPAYVKPKRKATAKRKSRKQDANLPPPPRTCGVCGDVGDHDGDGHPYERDEEGAERVASLRERWAKWKMRPPLQFRRDVHEAEGYRGEEDGDL